MAGTGAKPHTHTTQPASIESRRRGLINIFPGIHEGIKITKPRTFCPLNQNKMESSHSHRQTYQTITLARNDDN